MEVYLPTPRLPTRRSRLSLLAAALSAAAIATLLSASLTGPEPGLSSQFIPPAKPLASARAAASAPPAPANQSQAVSNPDQRKGLVLFILYGLAGHPLGILK